MKLAALETDRSTKAALWRVLDARARVGCARVAQDGPRADPLYLRKRVKELRGLLRLLRSGLPEARAIDRALGDAAQGLGQTRDLDMMLDCLDRLTAGLRDPAQFSGLRNQILQARSARQEPGDQASAQAIYAETLDAFLAHLPGLTLTDKASRLMWRNARKTYRRARQDHARAHAAFHAGDDAGPFHEWRKSVKRHWYQARFLAAMKPDRMTAHIAAIDRLGKTLGAHNDLDVLMRFFEARALVDPADIAARDILRRHALAMRKTLARAALDEAEAALAAPPAKLIAKWQRWWRAWRDDRNRGHGPRSRKARRCS